MPVIHRLTHDVVMTVRLSRQFHIRAWIATFLIWLAAWILGCRVEIVDTEWEEE